MPILLPQAEGSRPQSFSLVPVVTQLIQSLLNHILYIRWAGMEDLLQDLFGSFQFQLLFADLYKARFLFPKSHENTSNVACEPGISISAFDRPLEEAFGIS